MESNKDGDRLLKKMIPGALFIALLSASCGPVAVPQQGTAAPLTLPPTWTPIAWPTGLPTATEFPTYTPVPPVPPLPSPTFDSFEALHEVFQDSLFSPNGKWTAYRDPDKLRVVSNETTRVWTLPCELFDECSTVFPVKWARNQVLYFAPAPAAGGPPKGIMALTALATIDMRTGKWELVLPDSERHYDFGFSPDDEYIAYTQSSGSEVDEPSVTLGIINLKEKKDRRQLTMDGPAYAGNIVWSPFRPRFVFVTYDPQQGSAVGYYDIATGFLKYALEAAPRDIIIAEWGQDNLVSLEIRDWTTNKRTFRVLNPFTGELLGD